MFLYGNILPYNYHILFNHPRTIFYSSHRKKFGLRPKSKLVQHSLTKNEIPHIRLNMLESIH
jgi:hypothetical protein